MVQCNSKQSIVKWSDGRAISTFQSVVDNIIMRSRIIIPCEDLVFSRFWWFV